MKGGMMKKVCAVVICITVMPMLMHADNGSVESNRGFQTITNPDQTQERVTSMFENRDGWLTYDDGVPYWSAAWDSGGDGAGVQYVAPYDCRVGTVKVYMGNPSWPSPGGNYGNFALYSGATQPTTSHWFYSHAYVTRGSWNSIWNDTLDNRVWPGGSNIYGFYFQDTLKPYCPSFSADNGCNYPQYSWTYWQLGGGFFNENPSGDWMLRLYVYSETGVGEWLSYTPIGPDLMVRTVTTGLEEATFTLHEPAHVELLVYDIIGKQRTTLVSQHYAAGTHVVVKKLDLPVGIYFCNLKTDTGFNIAEKFIIVH
jgi:hypothetical protein